MVDGLEIVIMVMVKWPTMITLTINGKWLMVNLYGKWLIMAHKWFKRWLIIYGDFNYKKMVISI